MRKNTDVMIVSHLSSPNLAALLNSPDKSTRFVFTILQLYAACAQSQNKKIENCHVLGKVVGDDRVVNDIHFVNVNFSSAEALEKLVFNRCRFENCFFKNENILDAAIDCYFSDNIFEEGADEKSLSSLSRGFFEKKQEVFDDDDVSSQLSDNECFGKNGRTEFNLPSFNLELA
ncbi:MAG: hypothetical protein Q8L78_01255 [Coxiellaceae bacterium]|nr:hypothetical protein [Coxiellaceae bacterium]